ncbi:MAG TPA: FixH family protein [Candidatus Cybelea sp.]|nr:FixH family protein [Candidatus Cybelea sp.]
MPALQDSQPQRRSLWIPGIFVGGMLVVIAVNAALVYFATHTFSGLDTDAYYQEGVQYNAVLKDAAASAALGWSAKADIQPNGGSRRLSLWITDKSGLPLTGLKVSVHMVRTISTAFDQLVTMQPSATEQGVYVGDVHLSGAGIWELRITATGGKVPWESTQRLFVK